MYKLETLYANPRLSKGSMPFVCKTCKSLQCLWIKQAAAEQMTRDPATMSDQQLAEWAASLDANMRRRIQAALLNAAEESNTGSADGSNARVQAPPPPLPAADVHRRARCSKACPNASQGVAGCRMFCKRKDKPWKRYPHRSHYCGPCHSAGYGVDSE